MSSSALNDVLPLLSKISKNYYSKKNAVYFLRVAVTGFPWLENSRKATQGRQLAETILNWKVSVAKILANVGEF